MLVLALPLALLLAQAAVLPSPGPAASPSAAPPTAAPSPSPSPAATPSPAPTNPFQFVVHPSPAPSGAPQILAIEANSQVQHEGADLLLRVTTSPDVFQLQLRAMSRIVPLPQAGPGIFGAIQHLPTGIPFFFLNRWYNVDFVATTQDGRSTTVTVPFRFER